MGSEMCIRDRVLGANYWEIYSWRLLRQLSLTTAAGFTTRPSDLYALNDTLGSESSDSTFGPWGVKQVKSGTTILTTVWTPEEFIAGAYYYSWDLLPQLALLLDRFY